MTKTKANPSAVALRRGQLLSAIEGARHQIEMARRGFDLLPESDRAELERIKNALMGIEQRAWERAK